jgi:hypothetical protein
MYVNVISTIFSMPNDGEANDLSMTAKPNDAQPMT